MTNTLPITKIISRLKSLRTLTLIKKETNSEKYLQRSENRY